jgi:hypothetical protein
MISASAPAAGIKKGALFPFIARESDRAARGRTHSNKSRVREKIVHSARCAARAPDASRRWRPVAQPYEREDLAGRCAEMVVLVLIAPACRRVRVARSQPTVARPAMPRS